MPLHTIKKDNNSGYYFTTCTVEHWYYIFDRHNRWQILADSLIYCIKYKNLKLFGFVFMLNHIHLLFSSPDSAGFIRDFKKFTSKKLKNNILSTEPNLLKLFINKNEAFHLWQDSNMPIIIESEKVFGQKLIYIHNNPVRKNYVLKPEYWFWSSANPECSIPLEKIIL